MIFEEEILNPKQIQMTEIQNSKQYDLEDITMKSFKHLYFEIRYCLEFRI